MQPLLAEPSGYVAPVGPGKDHSSSATTSSFRIEGMTCSACSTSIESVLSSIPGIYSASVSLLQNTAEVSYDGKRLTVTIPIKMANSLVTFLMEFSLNLLSVGC